MRADIADHPDLIDDRREMGGDDLVGCSRRDGFEGFRRDQAEIVGTVGDFPG